MVNYIGTEWTVATALWPSIPQWCPEYSPKMHKAFLLVEVLIGKGRNVFLAPRSFLGYEYSMTGRWDNAIEWILKFSLFSLFLNIGEGHVVWCQTSYLPQVPNIFLSTTHSSPSSHQLEISTVCQVLVMTLRQFNDCLNLNKSHNIVDDHLCKHVIIFNKYPKQEVCRA